MLGRELPFAFAFPSLGVGNRGCCPSTTTEVMPAVPTLQNLYSATSQSGFVTEGLIRGDTRGCCLSLVSKPRFSGHEYACVLSGKIMKKIYWKEISLCKSRCLASGYFARETFLFLEVFHLKGSYWICKKNRLNVFLFSLLRGECVWAFFHSWVVPSKSASVRERDSNLVDSASSIRLSQRLSHACLSINKSILWNCEWLIISVIVYLMVFATWITVVILELIHAPTPIRAVFIRWKPMRVNRIMVIHNNFRIDLSMHHSSFCPISFGW